MKIDKYENQQMSATTFEVHHKKDKDFKTVEMHSHDFSEVYFFLQGSATYIIEDCKYALRPGDVLIIPPNKLHQLDIKDSAETYERFVLWLNQRYLKHISTAKTDLNTCFLQASAHNAFLVRNGVISDKIRHGLDAVAHSQDDAFGSDVENEERIKALLVILGQYFLQNADDFAFYGKNNPCVTKAIDYISEHIAEDLSLDTIASALFVDKYYFAHVFKENTNTSPHRYILKKRLVLSKQFIEQGYPVTEVYVKCGFSDYTHFFRAFKNEYGITPKQFYASINLQ